MNKQELKSKTKTNNWPHPCPIIDGGKDPKTTWHSCPKCMNDVNSQLPKSKLKELCPCCDGDGYFNDGSECPDCDGTGNNSSHE